MGLSKMQNLYLAVNKMLSRDRRATLPEFSSLDLSIHDIEYCSPAVGRLNMRSDLMLVGSDLKKATKEAQSRVKNGQATPVE
jgi:hypothetical protein